MQTGYRFRCYPTSAQAQTLLQWIGCQRHIYNAKVQEDRYFRSFARKSLTQTGAYAPIDQQYSQFKTELTPWLSELPSQILRNGAYLWKQAYARYFQKLAGRPVIHKKGSKQSVWVTSELFEFRPVIDPMSKAIMGYELHVGTKKYPLGVLAFKAHRDFVPPQSLHLSVANGRWHLSFAAETELIEPSAQEIEDAVMQFSEPELQAMTVGLDRGVALSLAGSDGQKFHFTAKQEQRLLQQEKHKKRWQKRLARRTKGSKNWVKAKRKVARHQRYGVDVRRDLAHQTSHALVADARYQVYVLEALKVVNMTKRAKPKRDENGKWLRNHAAAKSGLNKAILGACWGSIKTYLSYKARRQGKMVLEVSAFYSSQECSSCGFTHKDNRLNQAEFVCQSCRHTEHADHNAAKVIAKRGVQQILLAKAEGLSLCEKKKKNCTVRRQKVGVESSEPVVEKLQPTLGEIEVSRSSGNTLTHWSSTQETPAIALA